MIDLDIDTFRTAARAGKTLNAIARGLQLNPHWLGEEIVRRWRTTWAQIKFENPRTTCFRGHPLDRMRGGKCSTCRSEWEAASRKRGRSVRAAPKPRTKAERVPVMRCVPAKWTWFDWMEQCERDETLPHHLKRAPDIKEWLERNRIKP